MKNKKIAIIGLGYVGLPLAVEFSKKKFQVVGYDTNEERIESLKIGQDETNEVELDTVDSNYLTFTDQDVLLENQDIYIITVPTPIDKFNHPDLSHLIEASKTVGVKLTQGNIVIYESTVYPGCTEEEFVPILEQYSNLTYNKDFFCGYSPERINPGDIKRKVNNIVKVTSGSTKEIAIEVDNLYKTDHC